MKNNITELVFILDRSGSMSGLEQDTIGGFNSHHWKATQTERQVLCFNRIVWSRNRGSSRQGWIDHWNFKNELKTIIRFVAQLHSLTLSAVQFITLATFISMQEKKMFPNTPCLWLWPTEWKTQAVSIQAIRSRKWLSVRKIATAGNSFSSVQILIPLKPQSISESILTAPLIITLTVRVRLLFWRSIENRVQFRKSRPLSSYWSDEIDKDYESRK